MGDYRRKTKIVCTLGPASEGEEVMRKIILAGMNVARFNFSHGEHDEREKKVQYFKEIKRRITDACCGIIRYQGT